MHGAPDARPLTTAQWSTPVLLAASAGAMPSLQPLLLGGMLDQHQIVAIEIGQAAAAEALGMAASFAFASSLYRSQRTAPAVTGALLLMACANLATGFSSGLLVVALRAIAGLGGGMLLWVLIRHIIRAPSPARVFAVYASVQAAWGFALSAFFSYFLIPSYGPAGAYLTFAAVNLIMLGTVQFLPRLETDKGGPGRRRPPIEGLVGLIGVGLFMGGLMAFWSYAVPLVREVNGSGIAMELAIPPVICAHILGGMVAAATSRFPPLLACVGGPLMMIACICAVLTVDSIGLQLVLLLLFAVVWMFVPPFQIPFLLGIDRTARTAMYVSSSQLVGIAVGPLLASSAVEGESVAGTLGVAMFCLAGAALLPLVATRLSKR